MRTLFCSLVLMLVFGGSSAQVDPEKAMEDLQQLVGEWKTTPDRKGKFTTEVWQPDSIGLSGTGMEIKGDKTVFEEFLRLFLRDGTLYYSARIPNQNKGAWIDFAMTEHTQNMWLFENPAHDFPRKIRYTLGPADDLSINVRGKDGGFDLEMKRKE